MSKTLKISMEVIVPDSFEAATLYTFFEDTELRLNEFLDGEPMDDCDVVEVKNVSIFNKYRDQ